MGFVLGDYDRRKELIIDPVLAYSGFFGDQNGANAIAVDSDGNAYVTGLGSGEFVVAKVKADGSALLYTSLFTNADPEAIAVDAQGNAYITGGAQSIQGIPVVNALQPKPVGGSSAFLMKLDPTGSKLIYSTFSAEEIASDSVLRWTRQAVRTFPGFQGAACLSFIRSLPIQPF